MTRRVVFLFVAAAVVVLDQISKHWCIRHLPPGVPVPFLDHALYLTLTYNARGAFSLFALPNPWFVAVVAALVLALAAYVIRIPVLETQGLIGLVIGGGVGNLLDRIRLGVVVDFLDLRWWPVFNIADSAVSAGIVMFVFASLRKRP